MKRPLSRLTRRPSPISYGEYICDAIIAFLLLKKSTSMSSSPASIRATSSASMPAGLMSNGRPPVHQRVPDLHRALRRHPDLVAEIAGVAGARDVDRHAGDGARSSRGNTSSDRCPPRATARSSRADVGPCSASAATSSEMSSTWTSSPSRVLPEPAQARIRRRPAERAALPAATPSRRRSPCRARRTTACRRPGRPPSSRTSRVMIRSTRRAASGPVTRYLNSGETSISAAALRIALYSCS